MKTIHVNLVVEDDLSETVLRRLLKESRRPYVVAGVQGRCGSGYIKKRISSFNKAAAGSPYLVLTDLDTAVCAPALVKEWLADPRHANCLFRVAVREVEAWLLADRAGLAAFLGVSEKLIPANPEQVADPKMELVRAAKRSRYRRIREDIVPAEKSTSKQGPAYNSRLAEFVEMRWSLPHARSRAPSLERMVDRLEHWVVL